MARVLLVNPPSPERLGAPLLGQQYVAAALLGRGHEVRVIDAAARYFDHDEDWIVGEAERFRPDVIGFGLFTRWVFHAYALTARLRERFPLLVAGGAHVTVRPDEVLERGFDFAVMGEAEESFPALVDWVERGRALESVPGIRWRGPGGAVHETAPARFVDDLDALPLPQDAQHLFEPAWYDPAGQEIIPGGVLTSRGCPARCTFCANYVTGRGFRYRSAERVADELNRYHARTGATFFPFWDDARTANTRRLYELCRVFEERVDFPLSWSAITRANMVSADLLAAMKRAGCVHVNFGVESGDDAILRAIKKGVTTEQVHRALELAKEAGLMTAANFMLGFPQETPQALERTLRFMERIAPLTDTFSTLGVVVPFPGTPLYDDFVAEYGFADWWLREEYARYEPAPDPSELDRYYRHAIDDATLELDFFRYTPETRAMIRACLRFKGEHNLREMGLLRDPVYAPAASAAE